MKTLTLSALALSLCMTTPLFASHGKNCSEDCGCPYMQTLKKAHLSLTTEQKNKIKLAKAQAKPLLQNNQNMIIEIREQINTLTKAKTLDQRALKTLIHREATLIAERTKIKANVHHQIYNVLTPAQQAKWNKVEQNKKKKHTTYSQSTTN